MLELFERIDVLAHSDAPLLIRGESGSGKELVARAVHAASSRRSRPMIALNCATIPTSLMESELFGDDAGSEPRRGLIEAAAGSTLFLDEIGSLTVEAQSRLLSQMQQRDERDSTIGRPVDVRIIAATHRDLRPLVDAGRFSAGLYERLIATALTVPPLRERGSDITELATRLLRRICFKLSKPELTLSEAALSAIAGYDWPGNVRELENALERAVILCDNGVIEPELLAIDVPKSAPSATQGTLESDGDTSLERYFVKFVLDHQDAMTETELASKLGISRKSLWERRQRLNIPRKRSGARALRRDDAV
jgi:two-component system response regulator HydG